MFYHINGPNDNKILNKLVFIESQVHTLMVRSIEFIWCWI